MIGVVILMSVGNRITQLRKQIGLTRAELAQRLEIPQTTLRNYEMNLREPRYELLIKIANEFQVSTDYLLGVTNEPYLKEADQKKSSSHEDIIKLSDRLYSVLVDSGIITPGEDLSQEQLDVLNIVVDFIAKIHKKKN